MWYYGNVACMFVSFAICRLYYTVYISYVAGSYVYRNANWDKLDLIKAVVTAQMACIVIASLALNAYWFWLMCKMIVRVLGRMLFPKKEEESIELVKADALKQRGSEYYGSSDEHGGRGSPDANRKDKVDELGGLEV